MEPTANRTQVDAFHASFQALLEKILFQTACRDRIKLGSEMRHRSRWRCSSVVERWSVAGELSLACTGPAALMGNHLYG